MNLKKLIVFLVLSLFCIPTGFVFAGNPDDLELDEGKTYLFDFRKEKPEANNLLYDKNKVYNNVNIGAGTKVVLDTEWQYVLISSNTAENPIPENREVTVLGSTQTVTVQDQIYVTSCTYRKDEVLATLSVNDSGSIILNAGSELSIRNQYSLVTSTQEVSLEYEKIEDSEHNEVVVFKEAHLSNMDYTDTFGSYKNRKIKDGDVNLFTGNIVFENGDTDTILTFQEVADKTSEEFVLPDSEGDIITDGTEETGFIKRRTSINDKSEGMPDNTRNIVKMYNDFEIKSNRAVFNVVGGKPDDGDEWNETSRQVILGKLGGSYLSGDGTIVKKGEGTLTLSYGLTGFVDGTGLTGLNTGYSWQIEEGMVTARAQDNLGTASIYIDSKGTLGLGIYSLASRMSSPTTVISDIQSGQLETRMNVFENKITSCNGEISIGSGCLLKLSGDITTDEANNNLRLTFYENSALMLTGSNDAEQFSISFGGKYGGQYNYLVTDVDGLASKVISVKNSTDDDFKEFAFFELVLDEDRNNQEYSGSLQGDMYLRKIGSGVVTISGNNTYDKGTYITEGGLMLATSDALGTGKIMFDSDSSDYASIGVSSETTTGDINVMNNIHVKKGAILNVAEGQNMYLKGDLVRYDARPGYEAEFVKNGLGNTIISQIEGVDRKINISTFTVTEGGFILDKGVASDSYFSISGEQAFLEIRENAAVKNNDIDIFNGDLRIFNDECISSATAITFHSTETVKDSFSKFHIISDSVLSDETIAVSSITIAKNIEFVVGSTTTVDTEADNTTTDTAVVTAQMNKFDFQSGAGTIIVKSGDGDFIAEGDGNFALDSLYVNGGKYGIENTTMTVSGETLLDGGILAISQTSHFASSATAEEDRKITVLDGSGISIYDGDSIAKETKLMFVGTDTVNLSKLVIEGEAVVLKNSIYVDTGLIIENKNDFTFKGEYLKGEYGILAKSGAGTMTINSSGTFNMGELRSLEGNLLVNSDINVSTISIRGEEALLSFDGLDKNINATIAEKLSLENGGTLSISTATVDVKNLDLTSAHVIINKDSNLISKNANFNYSDINLIDTSSVIKAETINLMGISSVVGYGKLDATVNVGNGSSVTIGTKGQAGESLIAKDVVFETGSELYIDIDSNNAINPSDKLLLSGDITVQKDVTLVVNFIEEESGNGAMMEADSDYDKPKKFEIITFIGNHDFANPTSEIFNISLHGLNDARFSASTSLIGKSIFLEIAQKFALYSIPGATKNQQAMIDVLNDIHDDTIAKENLNSVFSKLDQLYSTDKAQFLSAVQDLSGIFYANAFMTSAMLSKANILYSRLNENSDEREDDNRVWAQVYTNSFSVAENDENPEFKNNFYGMIAGYDTIQDEALVFGFAGFYGQGELTQLDDKADVVDAGANVYGDYKVNDNIDVKGLIGYSMQDYDTTRTLKYNNQKIKSSFATNTISLDLEAAYKLNLGEKLSLKPLLGANCAIVSNGDIEEDGDTEQRLKINKGTYSKAEVRVGVGLQGISDSPFNWHVAAALKHIISGNKFTTKSSFVKAPGYEFELESTELSGTSFSGLFGCSYDINENINISLDVNADAGAVSQFGGNIGASYKW